MAPATDKKLTTGLKALIDFGGPMWLGNHVDAWLERAQEGHRRDPGWFHPSDLTHGCDAYLAFLFLGAPEAPQSIPARTQRIFDLGHARDRDWKRYLQKSGLSVVSDERAECPKCGDKGPEVEPGVFIGVDGRHICMPDIRVRGEFDDLVKSPFDGELYLFEMKTKNHELFTKLRAPDLDHVIQVQTYMAASGIHRCLINYENKNDQNIKTFEVRFDGMKWLEMTKRIERILDQLAGGHAPTRVPVSDESKCRFNPICAMANFPELVTTYRAEKGLMVS